MTSETLDKLSLSTSKLSTSSYTHLRAYPLISDLNSYILQFRLFSSLNSYAHVLITNLFNLLNNCPVIIINTLNYLDSNVDNLLNFVDRRFPILTSITIEDLGKIATNYYNSFVNYSVKTFDDYTSSLRVYLNNRFKFIIDYYNHMLSVIKPYFDTVSSYPQHITTLYADEKSSGSSTSLAIAKTSRRLSNEVLDATIKPTYENRIKPTVNKFLDNAKNSVNGVADLLDHNVEKIGEDVDVVVSQVIETVTDVADGAPGGGSL